MNETYYEILVARKPSPMMRVVQLLCALLTVGGVLAMFMGVIWGLLIALISGVACYLVGMKNSVEYEYLYVDKELQIDRILAKSKRKKVETLDLNQLEVLAPIRSHELDSYRNRKGETKDYSSADTSHDNQKYMLVVADKQIIFEPTEELVKTIRMFAPRKVFTY